MFKYLKQKQQRKMWKDLKDFECSGLYCSAVTLWEMNRPLYKLKRKFWRCFYIIKKKIRKV